jgi:hypothetical protein
MKTNVFWKGLYYQSLEDCCITESETIIEIASVIIGADKGQLYKVDYRVQVNKKWEIIAAQINSQLNNSHISTTFQQKDGQCYINGTSDSAYVGFKYIDISLSPFTNTLPINSLQLRVGQQAVIDVVYFDILGQKILPARQIYTRLSASKYRFETDDKSFSADIEVDKGGFVTFYPQLFEKLVKAQ